MGVAETEARRDADAEADAARDATAGLSEDALGVEDEEGGSSATGLEMWDADTAEATTTFDSGLDVRVGLREPRGESASTDVDVEVLSAAPSTAI